MSYQNILVHLPLAANGYLMQLAFAFARAFDAHLTGLCVLPDTAMLQVPGQGPLIQSNETDAFDHLRQDSEQAAALGRSFNAAADQLQISHDWLVGEGDKADVLVHAARLYDLAIVPRLESKVDLFWGPATQLALSGCPTLCVAQDVTLQEPPERILVAWNGSAPAAAAVRSAMPLLKAVPEVVLLIGQAREVFPSWVRLPPIDLADYLQRSGVNVEAINLEQPDSEAGEQILKTAQRCGAELIVMGAFGRSRFREWVLGGATRHVLEHMTTPVLMAH